MMLVPTLIDYSEGSGAHGLCMNSLEKLENLANDYFILFFPFYCANTYWKHTIIQEHYSARRLGSRDDEDMILPSVTKLEGEMDQEISEH